MPAMNRVEIEEDQRERAVAPGQRGERVAGQVDAQGDDEQVLAAERVGQLAEEQRAEHLAEQVDGGDGADLGRC